MRRFLLKPSGVVHGSAWKVIVRVLSVSAVAEDLITLSSFDLGW
jgi:hypothetical protein